MPSGTIEVDFGAFPGAVEATVAIPDTGVVADSEIGAFVAAVASSAHTADEHAVAAQCFEVIAHDISPGVGFSATVRHKPNPGMGMPNRLGFLEVDTQRTWGTVTLAWARN